MSTSQRVSRGFHRLALFLAAIPLLIGTYFSIVIAYSGSSTEGDVTFTQARLAITLAVSLAVYGVVRAIGWVIGGFAA